MIKIKKIIEGEDYNLKIVYYVIQVFKFKIVVMGWKSFENVKLNSILSGIIIFKKFQKVIQELKGEV